MDRPVYVLENVIEAKARKEVYEYFIGLPYYFRDSDRSDTRHVMHLVHYFPRSAWSKNPILRVLASAAKTHLSNKQISARKIDRIYANLNLHGDIQYSHVDGNEWTALTFINERWAEDWGGELLLYNGKGTRKTAFAIPPSPGRMVIFDGNIHHRGGVPSKLCLEPRISLAIKFARL